MHNRWVALNEWGCNPDRWHLPVERFHEHQKRRLDRFPRGLLSRQTHDTFHSSDARARMVALTHRFKEWQARVNHWFQLNKHAHFHPNIEYRVYQDLCSVWPIEKDRFLNHIRKWFSDTNGRAGIDDRQPNRERLTLEFAERLFENTEFLSDLDSFVKTIVASGRFVAMGQLLLQLTSPGIPDIYWGDELEVFSLADPDQRRPVDWTKRKQVLAKIQARCCERASVAADSREIGLNDTLKMRIIVETLRLRNQFASVFSHGAYEPVNAGADVCAFTRGGKVMTVVPLTESAKKLDCLEGWSDLFPDLPVGLYVRTEGP
jgi:(1->4)-alpha-D-glucan 1-alpha-D-glucosylmutase